MMKMMMKKTGLFHTRTEGLLVLYDYKHFSVRTRFRTLLVFRVALMLQQNQETLDCVSVDLNPDVDVFSL